MRLTAAQKRATDRWARSPADQMAIRNGCWFDTKAATHVCTFFETFLRHSKGQWAGEPFKLLKWQAEDVIKPLFGWMRDDGTRRYRTSYIEIPKKMGKSTMCAGLALYGLVADGEPGSEVYSAAASRDQAAIVYKEAATMRKASPSLNSRILATDSQKHMADAKTNSWYKALCAEAGLNEGLNIHMLIMDEMHAQPNDKFWNALMYGGAARRQPIQIIITTAGVDQDSLCYEFHTKAMQIQQGLIQDDSFFAYVRSAEWAMVRIEQDSGLSEIEKAVQKEACWKDEAVWHEANPSLGETVSQESFREDFRRAVQSPRMENAFKRYRLNIWTQQDERWLPMDHWMACGEALGEEPLLGMPCYAGLDLAESSDLCALVLLFPEHGNAILPFFWLPDDTVKLLEEKGEPHYAMWKRQGFLRTTEGNVADFDVIREEIRAISERFAFQELAYDRYRATQLITQLQGDAITAKPDGIVGFGQGYLSMSAPCFELERLMLGHGLRHGNHPIMNWCVGNVAVTRDPAGNIKPNKAASPKKKIDGVVALAMALGRAMVQPEAQGSVYETRGILTL